MRLALGALVIIFNSLDSLTTFLCLREPVPGFEVIEANPFARWLFEVTGLVHGLLLETVITVAAVTFLVLSPSLPSWVRTALLVVLVVLPAWAVVNNVQVMAAVGVWL
jgi:hypothetical protein